MGSTAVAGVLGGNMIAESGATAASAEAPVDPDYAAYLKEVHEGNYEVLRAGLRIADQVEESIEKIKHSVEVMAQLSADPASGTAYRLAHSNFADRLKLLELDLRTYQDPVYAYLKAHPEVPTPHRRSIDEPEGGLELKTSPSVAPAPPAPASPFKRSPSSIDIAPHMPGPDVLRIQDTNL